MSTPIFDQLATETPGLLCPICGAFNLRPLIGDDDEGDLAVCIDCWLRGLHRPEIRAERTCVDCGKYCFGFEAMVLVMCDRVLPLCREDYERRVIA